MIDDRFKFRFWDKKEKEYFTCGDIDHKSGIFKTYPYITYNWCFEHKNIIAEQCTGLKDKNGQLIYENDILRSESYPFKSDNEYHYAAEVCFDEESAVFFYYVFRTSTKVAGRAEGNTGELNECDWEIIGNIHENADLLENNND